MSITHAESILPWVLYELITGSGDKSVVSWRWPLVSGLVESQPVRAIRGPRSRRAPDSEALLWALDDAAVRPESELRVVLAWQLPFLSNPAAFDRDELQLTYEEFLIKTVSEIVPVPQFPLETLVAMGETVETLVEAAEGAQLLVLGGRGRSAFAGLMLGAVSQACAARADSRSLW